MFDLFCDKNGYFKTGKIEQGMTHFVKYSGAGNDFLILQASQLDQEQVIRWCHRNEGVGADGIMTFMPQPDDTVAFRIYNADGSEAAMCGNGARCLAHHMASLQKKEEIVLQAASGQRYSCWMVDELVLIHFPPQQTSLQKLSDHLFFIDTGVPHVLLCVDSWDEWRKTDWNSSGCWLRNDPRFAPAGANANLCFIDEDANVWVRTYERGVEGETLACGTGAVAAAFLSQWLHGVSTVKVTVLSEAVLTVTMTPQGTSLIGPARKICEGILV